MSLRARVLVGMAAIALMLAAAAIAITRTTEAHLVAQVDTQLRSAQTPLRGFDLDGHDGGGPPRFSSFYVGMVDADGSVTTLFTPNTTAEDLALPSIDGATATAAAASDRPFTSGSVGSDLRYRVLARVDDHSRAVVVTAIPLSGVDMAVHRLVAVEVAATLAVLAVLAVVAWWVIHLGVRPIKRMTATAGAIAAGELSHRVPDVVPGTEAGDLGAALNQMLGRIEDAFEQRARTEDKLRQFVADASHELRTPVTTIRGYAELYRSGALHDEGDLREAMRRTEQEAIRMGRLVEDLLELARLDQGRPVQREPVDLAVIAADAARDARAVDPDRPIGAAAAEPTIVIGDDSRLRQVVANVVGNALVHTDPGTPIELRVTRREGRAVLEVSDRGPGMPAEVARHVFERFYRADPARSRHRGGSGLGLSIVQATVAALGGEVAVDTAPGRGTTVRIDLPVAGGTTHSQPVPSGRQAGADAGIARSSEARRRRVPDTQETR